MKKFFKLRVWLILLAWGSILSCQKSEMESTLLKSESMIDRGEYARNLVDETIQGSYVVRNGILHFRDFESFDKISEQLKNMNIHDRTNFFSNYGFSSYANEVRMAQKKLDEAEDETTFNKILSDNQDILDVLDDKTIIPKGGDTFMNDFANRKGYLYIGKILHQFGQNFQKIAFDGKMSTINKDEESKSLLILDKYRTSSSNARNCQAFIKQVTNGTNDRRATVSTSVTPNSIPTGYVNGNYVYKIQWSLRLTGYPEKKNFWGNWVNYDTDNTLKSGFSLNVFPLNTNDPYGSRNVIVASNQSNSNQSVIYYDAWAIYENIPGDPETFIYEHSFYLDDTFQAPYPSNTYGTRGVDTFSYGCP